MVLPVGAPNNLLSQRPTTLRPKGPATTSGERQAPQVLPAPLVVQHVAQNQHTEVQLGLAPTGGGGFFASVTDEYIPKRSTDCEGMSSRKKKWVRCKASRDMKLWGNHAANSTAVPYIRLGRTAGYYGLLRTRQARPRALSMMPLTRSASQDEVGYEKI
ncbi:hypothetical protein NECAME_07273 [Necator americanus]|uniref:Uncharacterized protein n=1 Tax=Necator americanus TaxID=51031 RepID=W2TPG5_NECAM|nr:hypothetical protein NECAME_07273 [Necator americanus]ETN83668.1 hypothetical protein NECAME_07273 [Necator americanus]